MIGTQHERNNTRRQCVMLSYLEEQVWVEEQEMFPCWYFCVEALAASAVKELRHEWVCPC